MARSIACAVVHDDPPQVFLAEDIETLNWVLALELIARTPSTEVPAELLDPLRTALRDEHWATAVDTWMRFRPGNIDVYSSFDLHVHQDVDLAAEELQFTPLFRD